jgi:hypothetical protein
MSIVERYQRIMSQAAQPDAETVDESARPSPPPLNRYMRYNPSLPTVSSSEEALQSPLQSVTRTVTAALVIPPGGAEQTHRLRPGYSTPLHDPARVLAACHDPQAPLEPEREALFDAAKAAGFPRIALPEGRSIWPAEASWRSFAATATEAALTVAQEALSSARP